MYLLWLDPSPKTTPAQKIAEAKDAFLRRYGRPPTVILTREGGDGSEAAPWVAVGCVACGMVEE